MQNSAFCEGHYSFLIVIKIQMCEENSGVHLDEYKRFDFFFFFFFCSIPLAKGGQKDHTNLRKFFFLFFSIKG